ncbi:MAG: zinc-binding protein [Sporomusa sp.]|nr:zinc-binding protein [Sporomusa sp.]
MSNCNCGGVPEISRVVYGCGGCADVGEVSDRVCRQLRREGVAQSSMSCITGIAAHMQPFIDTAKKASQVVVIDGCPVLCAKKVLEHVDINPLSYVLTEMGLQKGKTEVTQEVVDNISNRIKADLT